MCSSQEGFSFFLSQTLCSRRAKKKTTIELTFWVQIQCKPFQALCARFLAQMFLERKWKSEKCTQQKVNFNLFICFYLFLSFSLSLLPPFSMILNLNLYFFSSSLCVSFFSQKEIKNFFCFWN